MRPLRILDRSARRLSKLPVVLLPLRDYEKMREELEMFHSRALARRIKKAREEVKRGNTLTLAQVKKRLKLS
jgi:PHD/YefM family antitoxin component YafN of YafNO toxin-antitoxin module